MKKILLLAVALFLIGCERSNDVSRDSLSIKSFTSDEFNPACIDGVVYYTVYPYGGYVLSPKFNADGTIATCLDEQSMIEYLEDVEYYNE